MLPLVVADGDVGGAVDKYVGGLQDGIREESQFEGGRDGVLIEGLGVVALLQFTLVAELAVSALFPSLPITIHQASRCTYIDV